MDFEEKIIDIKNNEANFDFDLSPKLIAGIAAVIFAAVGIWGSWFQVEANSVGMVMRLGEYVRQTGPGLHFKLPYGLEDVRKVPTEEQLKEEFGFRTVKAGVDSTHSGKDRPDESLMLTGDLNVVDVEWTVQYRIVDAEKFLFEVRNVRDTFRHMNQAVMREVVGDRTVNEVLTVGRTELGDAAHQKLQALAKQYHTGIRVDQVILQDITPPDPVKPSFNEVNQAQQQKEQLINEAKADYNKAIPSARGEAQATLQKAQGYAVNRVNRAKGEANRFTNLYKEYSLAPEVTRRRIYIETMGEVLPKVKRKIIIDGDTSNVLPLLPLGEGAQSTAGAARLSGERGAKR
jgi:membrane protease subunit HflK